MFEWNRSVQKMLDCIEEQMTGDLTLDSLAAELNYSPYYCTRQFHRYAGISLRDYIRRRRVSRAAIDLRDTGARIIDVAVKYGFSSQEAFTRSFKKEYGITPGQYRNNPRPLPLRVQPYVFDPDNIGLLEADMNTDLTAGISVEVRTIPAHKVIGVLHEGVGDYWNFWKKDEAVYGRDRCEEIEGILVSVKNRSEIIGARIVRNGKESYIFGVEMPETYRGEIPEGMTELDVPETKCAVFHHPAYDYISLEKAVDAAMDKVVAAWNPADHGYEWDLSLPYGGRHDPPGYGQERVKPLKKK